MTNVLTDVKVRNAKPDPKPRKLFDGRGLFLLVVPSGGKWWRFNYRYGAKAKTLSLGVYPDVGLKEARERRDAARRLLAGGVDPSADRKAGKATQAAEMARETSTFELVAREWFHKYSPIWAPGHAATIIRRLERDVFPWLRGRPAGEVTAVELLEVLRRVEVRGALETAHRIKQICGQVFRYALATGRASRDPSSDLRGALPPVKETHHAAITKPAEVAALLVALNGYEGSLVVRCALRLAPLVFVRPGELRKAEWVEIDFDGAIWRIPAERMKLRQEHLVPLSRQAINILRELYPLTGAGRYVFPSARTATRPMSENAITAALRRMGYEQGTMTAHGFRTTASTLLNELGWSADAIERQLAHAERDAVRGAYNRAEFLADRQRMMTAWADHLDRLTARATNSPSQTAAS
jgi:integrase